MIRWPFILFFAFILKLPLNADNESFRHKHKPQKVRQVKDPVSRKNEKLPKKFELKPTRRDILGQKH